MCASDITMKVGNEEQQSVVYLLTAEGVSGCEIHARMSVAVHGENSMSRVHVFEWNKLF